MNPRAVRAPDGHRPANFRGLTTIAIGLLASITCMPAFAATPGPVSGPLPHVRYYADGLEVPIGTMREVHAEVKECARLFSSCRARVESKMGPLLARTEAWLDLGPMFPPVTARALPPPASEEEAMKRVRVLLDRLVDETRTYDRNFVVRYGSVLMMCSPDAAKEMGLIANVLRRDIERFDGAPAGEYERVTEPIKAEIVRKSQLLREQWPDTTCQKALDLGFAMARAYWHKVKPFPDQGWQQVKVDRVSLAASSVYEMAYAITVEQDPSVATRHAEYDRANHANAEK